MALMSLHRKPTAPLLPRPAAIGFQTAGCRLEGAMKRFNIGVEHRHGRDAGPWRCNAIWRKVIARQISPRRKQSYGRNSPRPTG